MARIIPICNLKFLQFACALFFCALPSVARANDGDVDRYVSARLAEIANQDNKALSGYAALFQLRADSTILADRLFNTAIRQGDMANALRSIRVLSLKGKAAPEAPLFLFADAFRRENWGEARAALNQMKDADQFSFLIPILNGWVNVAQGKDAGLPNAATYNDKFYNYYVLDQRIYFAIAMHDYQQAKSSLKTFPVIDAAFVRDLMVRAAPIMAGQGEADLAKQLLAERVESFALPQLLEAHKSAKISAIQGLSALHTRLAQDLLDQKAPEQALIFARLALWYDPLSEPAIVALANAQQNLEMAEQAQISFAQIKPTSPYWTDAILGITHSLSAAKQYHDASLILDKANIVHPGSVSLANAYAQLLEDSGEYERAAAAYQNIVAWADSAKAPKQQRAVFRLYLATMQSKSGDWAHAKQTLEEARALDGDNPYILNYLGYSQLEHGEDQAAALSSLRQAFQLAPQSMAINDSLGWAYYQSGDVLRALPLLETAAKGSGNDMTINEHLGDAYWATGRMIDARYAWAVAAQLAEGDDSKRIAHKIDFGLPKVAQKT